MKAKLLSIYVTPDKSWAFPVIEGVKKNGVDKYYMCNGLRADDCSVGVDDIGKSVNVFAKDFRIFGITR